MHSNKLQKMDETTETHWFEFSFEETIELSTYSFSRNTMRPQPLGIGFYFLKSASLGIQAVSLGSICCSSRVELATRWLRLVTCHNHDSSGVSAFACGHIVEIEFEECVCALLPILR